MERVPLTILMPVYNEAATVASVVAQVAAVPVVKEIIIIDDGSKDGTSQILDRVADEFVPDQQTRALRVVHKPNGGKGSAIREGLRHATGEYTVIQDADLEYDPNDIVALLAHAKANPGAAVFGSRFLKYNPNLIYRRFRWGNWLMTTADNIAFGSKLTDSYTCYKMLPTEAFQSLKITANRFELEAEICAQCHKRGIRILELPVSYRPRRVEEGKKINWKDAVRGLAMVARQRFSR